MATLEGMEGPYLWSATALAGAIVLSLALYQGLLFAARKIAARTPGHWPAAVVRHGAPPLRAMLPLAAMFAMLPGLPLPERLAGVLQHVVAIGLVAITAWLCARLIDAGVEVMHLRYRVDAGDNLQARKVATQMMLLRRIALVAIVVVAGSLILMTFPGARQIGVTLFASAGLAGLVAGMAARSALSNLLAGIQIALTEPFRIDDVVIVEGEWGWIEEIGTTYVVVRIWDLRRLVVPLSYFLEHPFQNWTRTTADLLSTVVLYADYTVPVNEVRAELHRVLQASGLWDGKAWGLQVTDATEHALQLRALMSAPDSGRGWDLQCHVREKLVGFLRERYPQCLPRTRAELARAPAAA